MSEMDHRLRHLICCHLQEMLSPLIPNVSIQPFGSSVSGLGKYNCDMDMVLNMNSNPVERKVVGTEILSRFLVIFPGIILNI